MMIQTTKKTYHFPVFFFSIAREHSTPTQFLYHHRLSPEMHHSKSLGIGDHSMLLQHRVYNRRFGP